LARERRVFTDGKTGTVAAHDTYVSCIKRGVAPMPGTGFLQPKDIEYRINLASDFQKTRNVAFRYSVAGGAKAKQLDAR
jgi:hypothetical protein